LPAFFIGRQHKAKLLNNSIFVISMSTKTKHETEPVAELMRRLDAFWSKARDVCNEFYYDYDRGYAELENEPFECEVSSARIRVEDGDMISIDYSAVHVYDLCTNYCGPYDEEKVNVDEAYKQCEELCLEEAEKVARGVLNEYKKVIEKWAEKRGVAYTEELRRDELNFTLIIKLHSSGG
jgi:hypothetical protein